MLKAGDLKHGGVIKTATGYDATGKPDAWKDEFSVRFGINGRVISEVDESNNSGNEDILSLFTRYDPRLKNNQFLFIFGQMFLISQLDNVRFANRRLNFTCTVI